MRRKHFRLFHLFEKTSFCFLFSFHVNFILVIIKVNVILRERKPDTSVTKAQTLVQFRDIFVCNQIALTQCKVTLNGNKDVISTFFKKKMQRHNLNRKNNVINRK